MNCKACRYFAEINGMCRRYPAHEAIERPETHWCGEFANELTVTRGSTAPAPAAKVAKKKGSK